MKEISILEALDLARADVNTGCLEEAKTICEVILRLRPDTADAHYILGVAMLRSGILDAAEMALRKATSLIGNENIVLREALADVMFASGRWPLFAEEIRVHYQTDALLLRYLEMDIAYSCNLKCKSCSHYSNFSNGGIVDYEVGSLWMKNWSKRVLPLTFRLLGGEPMLNPRLCDYVLLAAELWPKSQRAIASNGFFVQRHPNLYPILASTNTRLDISIHYDSEEYKREAHLKEIAEAGRTYGFQVVFSSHPVGRFKQTYQGEKEEMIPYSHNQPEKSWQNCLGQTCTFLNEGKLWKCAPIALLGSICKQFHISQNPLWEAFLKHQGLAPSATDAEIYKYLLGPHQICSMCPI